MSIVLQSSGGGSVTIQEPTTASNLTATLPAATGQIMVNGAMPAFSAYLSSNQSTSVSTWTKVLYDTEEFDTNNNFASSRFTPTVAGYYQINATINFSTGTGVGGAAIYKNGSAFKLAYWAINNGSSEAISNIMYFNGTTDYIEIYSFQNMGTILVTGGQSYTFVSASMVRAA